MAIIYLNEIITNTLQIIALGSFFMLASKAVMHNMPYSLADISGQLFHNMFTSQPSGYQKRIAPEKISLSRQKISRQKISRGMGL